MSLVDLQHRIRDAVVGGDPTSLGPMLVGGGQAARRLAIHLRHYEASLTAAVVGRFPATGWLIGPRRLENAARRFVHDHPPSAPCIAEYGREFPAFLSARPETAALTYVRPFADLDWHLGRVAVSIEEPAVSRAQLAAVDIAALVDMRVTLQRGTHYVRAGWPIDTLMTMYLSDSAPDTWKVIDEEVFLEARGDRGSLRFTRVTAGDYVFRTSVAEGLTLGDASGRASRIDPTFEPGKALLALVDERLIVALDGRQSGGPS